MCAFTMNSVENDVPISRIWATYLSVLASVYRGSASKTSLDDGIEPNVYDLIERDGV